MKRVRYHRFGGVDQLVVDKVQPPVPGKSEILVGVKAAALNPLDGKLRRGEIKLMSGVRFPKVVGLEFSGTVLGVGPGVSEFDVGDDVFGAAPGSLSEQVIAKTTQIIRKPSALSHISAAGLPMCGQAALQALRDLGRVKPGQTVLVHGCTGGVGLFALRVASALGADVDGVCGTRGVQLAHEYGARQVIDYRKETLGDLGRVYDVALDLSGRLPFQKARSLLKPNGIYVSLDPSPIALLKSAVGNRFRHHQYRILITKPNAVDLTWLARQVAEGQIEVHVDQTFDLEDVQDAFRALERGGVNGKLVLETGSEQHRENAE